MQIIYEDCDILAINKSAGVVVHHDKAHPPGGGGTLIDEILEKYPEIKKVGDLMRPGIVHRLDKDTSGAILIAKNQKTFDFLKTQFQERKIEKKYKALVVGNVKNESGTINLPIGRSTKYPSKRVSGKRLKGKTREALTKWRVLGRFKGFTFLEVSPKTGRTHQIRSHLSAIGYPVVCDSLYAGKKFVCPFGLARQFLHASTLELALPTGLNIKLEADLPEDLQKVLQKLSEADINGKS
ncbi:RluA family pseudouridine synthase [Candidatus Giovannonibacteria bacterium]|nr:RluA family pseudouridine synthase [Candidatus Giovannonibacteria bacterium]